MDSSSDKFNFIYPKLRWLFGVYLRDKKNEIVAKKVGIIPELKGKVGILLRFLGIPFQRLGIFGIPIFFGIKW